MAARIKLESFETAEAGGDTVVMADEELEEARLAAYESGYGAGWDDAVAARDKEQGQIGTDLARSLQALSFTYHEARGHVLKALAPLLTEMAARVLPAVAAETLAPLIAQELRPLAAKLAEVPVTVVVSPLNREAVAAVLARETALPLTLVEEITLGEGEARLCFGDAEQRIDLDGAIAAIRGAVADYFSPLEEEREHG